MSLTRFKLVFFCPKDSAKRIIADLFHKFPNELGKIGNYEQCAFIQRGTEANYMYATGQFKPLAAANPTIGSVGTLEYVEEDKVEITVLDKNSGQAMRDAVKELKSVHPYEEVAYDVYKSEDF